MNIKLDTAPSSILPFTAQIKTEKSQGTEAPSHAVHRLSDQVIISPEGREAARASQLDSVGHELTRILDEEPETVWAAVDASAKQELKISYEACVDPDHTIWFKTYYDSLREQFRQEEQTIRDYYAEEHKKNSAMSFDEAWNYLTQKYLDPYSSFPEFRSDMTRNERLMAYNQERSMLITGRIYTWNDPYALASTGGPKKYLDMEQTAEEAANAKIEALIQEYKKAHGITDE